MAACNRFRHNRHRKTSEKRSLSSVLPEKTRWDKVLAMHNLAIYAELRMVGRGGSSPATPAIFLRCGFRTGENFGINAFASFPRTPCFTSSRPIVFVCSHSRTEPANKKSTPRFISPGGTFGDPLNRQALVTETARDRIWRHRSLPGSWCIDNDPNRPAIPPPRRAPPSWSAGV